MHRCTCCHSTTEIVLKMGLNTSLVISQSQMTVFRLFQLIKFADGDGGGWNRSLRAITLKGFVW